MEYNSMIKKKQTNFTVTCNTMDKLQKTLCCVKETLHKRVYTLNDFIMMIFFTVDKFCLLGNSYKWSYQKKNYE